MAEIKLNRLQTTDLIRPMTDAHWASLRSAHKEGKKICWSTTLLEVLARVMDIPYHMMPAYCSYVAGAKGEYPLFEAAEADAHLPDCCSYHRLHMGLLAMKRKGQPVREDIDLPLPDFFLLGRMCTEHSHYAEAVARDLKVPVVGLDYPLCFNESEQEAACSYVERQIREDVIPGMESIVGRRFDWDKFSEIMAIIKETSLAREECIKLAANIPSPWTMIDMMVTMAPLMYVLGEPGVEFYRKLKAELEERVAQKVGALSEEKYRLFWSMIPYGRLGVISRKLTSLGAVPLMSRYIHETWPEPEGIDPDRPAYSLARNYCRVVLPRTQVREGSRIVGKWVEKFHLDGLFMFNPRTCRVYGMSVPGIVAYVERNYGIPGVIIDSDHADPKMYSQAQLDTVLEALLEMIDARRKSRS